MHLSVLLEVKEYGRWKRSKGAAGWAIKEKLIWALQRFSVFSAALSSLERPGGGWSVWGWTAGSTGHCVGRGTASANLDCPWFVPFPAHSYVIICDKHLCSEATNPRQCPGLLSNSDKATRTDGASNLHEHTHTYRDTRMCVLTHLLTRRFTQTKLWAAVSTGFCVLKLKEGGYHPGCHIDTQQSSADFSVSCRAQHFPLSTLSSSKSPWQRTCWYPLLCQNWHCKKHLLPGCEQCWLLKAQQTDVKVVLFNTLWPPVVCFLSLTLETLFISL